MQSFLVKSRELVILHIQYNLQAWRRIFLYILDSAPIGLEVEDWYE